MIDEKLDWSAHKEHLIKKLRSATGALCRIKRSIPPEHYLKIYSSLFESHLGYGITVWGVVLQEKSNDNVFITQKHCVRVLFGDLKAFLNKHATCARARPFGFQKLGAEFYTKEHSKPIFNQIKILTVQSLFKYHCITELYKIMKFRTPYSLYNTISISQRDQSYTIILTTKSNTFLWKASMAWNAIHKHIFKVSNGFATSVSTIKQRSKSIILSCQALNDPQLWTPGNFDLSSIKMIPKSVLAKPVTEQHIEVVVQ